MQFKLDENMPRRVAAELVKLGHDAHTAASEGLAGSDDAVIASHAFAEGRIVVSFDLDFSDIRVLTLHRFVGVILLRTRTKDAATCLAALKRVLAQVPESGLPGNIVVVDEVRIRIRAMPG